MSVTACTKKRKKMLHPHTFLANVQAYKLLNLFIYLDYYNWDFFRKGNSYSEVGLLFLNAYTSFLSPNSENRRISCGFYFCFSLPKAVIL